jgi:hypothetical protein
MRRRALILREDDAQKRRRSLRRSGRQRSAGHVRTVPRSASSHKTTSPKRLAEGAERLLRAQRKAIEGVVGSRWSSDGQMSSAAPAGERGTPARVTAASAAGSRCSTLRRPPASRSLGPTACCWLGIDEHLSEQRSSDGRGSEKRRSGRSSFGVSNNLEAAPWAAKGAALSAAPRPPSRRPGATVTQRRMRRCTASRTPATSTGRSTTRLHPASAEEARARLLAERQIGRRVRSAVAASTRTLAAARRERHAATARCVGAWSCGRRERGGAQAQRHAAAARGDGRAGERSGLLRAAAAAVLDLVPLPLHAAGAADPPRPLPPPALLTAGRRLVSRAARLHIGEARSADHSHHHHPLPLALTRTYRRLTHPTLRTTPHLTHHGAHRMLIARRLHMAAHHSTRRAPACPRRRRRR